jgi:hypothetical protein
LPGPEHHHFVKLLETYHWPQQEALSVRDGEIRRLTPGRLSGTRSNPREARKAKCRERMEPQGEVRERCGH